MQKHELVKKFYNAFQNQINPIYNNLQMYLDGSEFEDEALEIIENNLESCIQECANDSCVSEFDDCPCYYVVKFGNETVSVEIHDGDMTIIGNHDSAIEAMKHGANDWVDYNYAEVLAMYGVQADESVLDLASENDENVKIWMRYYYFANHLGKRLDGWLTTDENGNVYTILDDYYALEFSTYQDAVNWIQQQERNYVLHGESSPPDFLICK